MGKKETTGTFDGTAIRATREKIGMPLNDLAEKLGVNRTTLWRWEKGDVNIPAGHLPAIKDFIFTNGASLNSQFTQVDSGYLLSAPLVTTTKYNDFIELDHIPTVTMNFYFDDKDSDFYIAFVVNESNMDNGSSDGLKKGDIVLSKRVRKDDFDEVFDKGKIYVLVKSDEIINTAIVDYDKLRNEVICHSYNSSSIYRDFPVNLNEVKDIYKVVAKATTV